MRLRNRFILIGIGIVLFIMAAPMIILFARGYKFDYETRQIVKTGSLIIKVEPEKTQVYLNDKLQKNNAPSTYRFILPGDYDIKIAKDGYYPWSKRLGIKSELVTWANLNREFVTLFLIRPELIKTTKINLAAISADNSELVYATNEGIFTATEKNGSQKIQNPIVANDLPILFESEGKLYSYLKNYQRMIFSDEQLARVSKFDANQNYGAYLLNGELFAINGATAKSIAENVLDFILEDNNLWFLSDGKIFRLNLNTNVLEIIGSGLIQAETGKIIRGPDRIMVILNGSLFIYNGEPQKIYDNVTFAHWDSESNLAVYGNGNEALIFDPDRLQSELILRSSTPISKVTLNQKTGYIFYVNEGYVKAAELDGRDIRNVFQITESKDGYLLSQNGETMLVYSETEITELKIR